MNILQTVVLGIVEGLTEFLPVSSTFHLIWTARILSIEQTPLQKLFEVAIQSGAILAVVTSFAKTTFHNPTLIKKVLLAFLPTAVIGFVLYEIIKGVFLESATLQLGMFIAVGIAFILFERFSHRTYARSISSITYREAFLAGIAQSLAVVPGVSRSGVVILALMALSVTRKDAAVFSFLLAVPTIFGASAFDIVKSHEAIVDKQDVLMLVMGFLVAYAVSLIMVKWLLRFLENHTMSAFGWYRIVVGLLLFLFFIST